MELRIKCSLRFTTSVSDWIVIWGSSQEFHIFIVLKVSSFVKNT